MKKFRNYIFKICVFFLLLPFAILIKLLEPFFLLKFYRASFINFGGPVLYISTILAKAEIERGKIKKNVIVIFYYKKNSAISSKFLLEIFKKNYFFSDFYNFFYYLEKVCNLISFTNNNHHSFDRLNYIVDQSPLKNFKLTLKFDDKYQPQINEIHETLELPKNAKWICVHARNSFDGYSYEYQKKNNKINFDQKLINKQIKHNLYRDIKIQDMQAALEKFTDFGYYVLIMGRQASKFNTFNKKIIDYSNDNIKSELADIYLLKNCSMYFGSDSGIFTLPQVFHIPIILAGISDIDYFFRLMYWFKMPLIPKTIFDHKTGSTVKFKDYYKIKMRRTPPKYDIVLEDISQNRFEAIHNTTEEYLNLAIESHLIFSSAYKQSQDQIKRQKELNKIFNSLNKSNFDLRIFMSDYFLEKHEYLLG